MKSTLFIWIGYCLLTILFLGGCAAQKDGSSGSIQQGKQAGQTTITFKKDLMIVKGGPLPVFPGNLLGKLRVPEGATNLIWNDQALTFIQKTTSTIQFYSPECRGIWEISKDGGNVTIRVNRPNFPDDVFAGSAKSMDANVIQARLAQMSFPEKHTGYWLRVGM